MEVKIIEPYGFCAGVELVLDKLNKIKEKHPNETIYCVGQIVHNNDVMQSLVNKGFVSFTTSKEEAIDMIDDGVVVFSAHGTSQSLLDRAQTKGLIVYDCICPFVKKSFDVIRDRLNKGYSVIYVGVKGHDESNAALSISPKIVMVESTKDLLLKKIKSNKIVLTNQTTLSQDNLQEIFNEAKNKYPNLVFENETCNSTSIRQRNLKKELEWCDLAIIVGDRNSNNTQSLLKIAKTKKGNNAILVETEKEIDLLLIQNKKRIIIASGASTPRENVDKIYCFLKKINKN